MADDPSAETTIRLEGDYPYVGFTFQSLATSELSETGREVLKEPSQLFRELAADSPRPVLVGELPRTILELLLWAAHGEPVRIPHDLQSWLLDGDRSQFARDAYAFAEYLSFERLVPFELSPKEEHSLSQIAHKSASRIVKAGLNVITVASGAPAVLAQVVAPAVAAALSPVIVHVAIAGGFVVVVVDTYGVVVGAAQSDKVQKEAHEIREQIRRAFDWLRQK